MSNDLKEAALKAVQKRKVPVKESPHEISNKLYRDYYSITDNEPIALEVITKRVIKRFLDIEKANVGAMLDLFFVYSNWEGFYSRTDSFSSYLQTIGLSKTHGYGILNAVKLLNEYFLKKGETNSEITDFMSAISNSIEEVGITKLIIISSIKDKKNKFNCLTQLLEGEEITAATLLKKKSKSRKKSKVKLVGQELKVGKEIILTLQTVDEKLIKAVTKTVDRFYSWGVEWKDLII